VNESRAQRKVGAVTVTPSSGNRSAESIVLAAIQSGDEAAFADLAAHYRRQLHVHCYRMLGSFDDAEDAVQETLLRAWRGRGGFQARSLFRTWLYRIATNVCLNALERAPRRVLPQDVVPPVTASSDRSGARDEPPWAPEIPWLEPYPDHLLDSPVPGESEPDAEVVSRETIELAYLAALQHLVPRQRAILILRDVLGWSAKEVADMLSLSVVSVNSALQRARSTMRSALPAGREDWTSPPPRSDEERTALQKFMQAWERSDATMLTSLLREDARWAMPPAPLWFDGRAAVAMLLELFPLNANGNFRLQATAANRQPAVASYLRRPGDTEYRFNGVMVLQILGGKIVEIVAFSETLCGRFGLPPTL
jgi:RNA polymerase sigma-70 factor, ECF subfamily